MIAESSEMGMTNKDILTVLCGQTSSTTYAFNPEIIAFRNKVIELQKNCSEVEWEQDMGATVPYCRLYKTLCNGQCVFPRYIYPCLDMNEGK